MSVRARRLLVAAATLGVLILAGCSSAGEGAGTTATPPTPPTPASTAGSSTSVPPAATTTSVASTPVSSTRAASTTSARPSPRVTSRTPSPARSKTPHAGRLPLDLDTGDATQVVTVVAPSNSATRATLQRWRKSGSGWRTVGRSVSAYLGADGIGRASESTSRTPAGSFTLTQAFGRNADPGTRLPYLRTTPDDYWISSPGPKYNTEQRCGDCGYDDGVNERLHEITPEYGYAVVIDYNTRNAPGGVKQGRGSAFFLHVEAGEPTAGCVAIPRDDLVDVLSWLTPSAHPRILLGMG